MLTYLRLKNFRSFSDVFLDLRGKRGEPKKAVFIYGENGSGKSNLMLALSFLKRSLMTMFNQKSMKELFEELESNEELKTERDKLPQNLLNKMKFKTLYPISDLIENNRMIGTDQPMFLEYGFRIDGADGSYFMEFSNDRIVREELSYTITDRKGIIFSIDADKLYLSPTVFFDTDYKEELKDNISKYWGKHSFMAILYNELIEKNLEYVFSRIGETVIMVINWFNSLSILCKSGDDEKVQPTTRMRFRRNLENGTISSQNDRELRAGEAALNTFFTQIYSDVKVVYYSFVPEKNGFH